MTAITTPPVQAAENPYASRLRPMSEKAYLYTCKKPIDEKLGPLAMAQHHDKRIKHVRDGEDCDACMESCVIRMKTCACCLTVPFYICDCAWLLCNTAIIGACSIPPAGCYGVCEICQCPNSCREPAKKTALWCCKQFFFNIKVIGVTSANILADSVMWPLNILAPEFFYPTCRQASCGEYFQTKSDEYNEESGRLKEEADHLC